MIVDQGLRLGTHSASAIFREARTKPQLRRAVRTAPRAWWHAATRKEGAEYETLWLPTRAMLPYGIGYLERMEVVVCRLGASTDWLTRSVLLRQGAVSQWVPLASPRCVFDLAAREWGLSCSACDASERQDGWVDTPLCGDCRKRARRYRSETHFALAMLDREIRKQRRAA
jgi:hypothetical protein